MLHMAKAGGIQLYSSHLKCDLFGTSVLFNHKEKQCCCQYMFSITECFVFLKGYVTDS